MLGDLLVAATGAGITLKSVFEFLGGAGMTGIGTAAAPTGAGIAVAAVGTALAADGVMGVGIGVSIAKTGYDNFGKDKGNYDYYKKLACDKFNEKWNKILSNSTKRAK